MFSCLDENAKQSGNGLKWTISQEQHSLHANLTIDTTWEKHSGSRDTPLDSSDVFLGWPALEAFTPPGSSTQNHTRHIIPMWQFVPLGKHSSTQENLESVEAAKHMWQKYEMNTWQREVVVLSLLHRSLVMSFAGASWTQMTKPEVPLSKSLKMNLADHRKWKSEKVHPTCLCGCCPPLATGAQQNHQAMFSTSLLSALSFGCGSQSPSQRSCARLCEWCPVIFLFWILKTWYSLRRCFSSGPLLKHKPLSCLCTHISSWKSHNPKSSDAVKLRLKTGELTVKLSNVPLYLWKQNTCLLRSASTWKVKGSMLSSLCGVKQSIAHVYIFHFWHLIKFPNHCVRLSLIGCEAAVSEKYWEIEPKPGSQAAEIVAIACPSMTAVEEEQRLTVATCAKCCSLCLISPTLLYVSGKGRVSVVESNLAPLKVPNKMPIEKCFLKKRTFYLDVVSFHLYYFSNSLFMFFRIVKVLLKNEKRSFTGGQSRSYFNHCHQVAWILPVSEEHHRGTSHPQNFALTNASLVFLAMQVVCWLILTDCFEYDEMLRDVFHNRVHISIDFTPKPVSCPLLCWGDFVSKHPKFLEGQQNSTEKIHLIAALLVSQHKYS